MPVPSVTSGFTMLASFDNGGAGEATLAFGSGSLTGTPSNMTSTNMVDTTGTFNDTGVNDSGCIGVRSNFGVNAEGIVGARYYNLSADLTGDVVAIHPQFSAIEQRDMTQFAGIAFGFCSGNDAANCAYWVLGGGNASLPDWGACLIDPTKTDTAAVHTGTFDPSNITQLLLGSHFNIGLKNAFFDSFGVISNYVLTAGEVANPGSFSDFVAQFSADDVNFVSNYSDLAYLCYFSPQIGDGTNFTYYRDTIRIIEFTGESSFSGSLYGRGHIDAGTLGFYIDASATDDIQIDQYVLLSTLGWVCDLKAAAGASVILNSCVFDGATTFTLEDDITLNSPSINNCGEIQAGTPTINAGTISGAGIRLTDSSSMLDTAINNNATGIIYDVAGSASVTLDGVTFSGNTVDIEYLGTGTLTVNITNGANPVTTSTPNGGTIDIQGAAVSQGISFTNLLADSQVFIFEAGTTTVIDSIESSGTSFSWVISYSADQNVDYTILKEGYLPIRVISLALSDSVAPVQVQQVSDRTYAASSGLTYATNVTIDTGLKTIDVTAATTVQNLRNAMIEFWRAQPALRNIAFPVITNGPNSFSFLDDWTLTPGSIANLSRDGVRHINSSDTVTDIWCAVLSVGDAAGMTAEYQQVDGAAPTDAKASGPVDQLIKIYENGAFDYRNYLVIKYQVNGYGEIAVDVVAQYGALEDQLYVVAMAPMALSDFTTGDPAPIGLTLTNHGASPVTWNSKDFSITITDTGVNSGETIWRWLNYNKSLDAAFQGEEPFNLFEMIQSTGSGFETKRGDLIGSAGAALKGVRVVDGAGEPHAAFTRFQCDDGTYYVAPVSASVSITNIVAGSRVRIYNETTATETYNGVPGTAYGDTYIDGTDYSDGDVISVYMTQIDGVTSMAEYKATVVAGSTGWSVIADQQPDTVYNTNGIDGSTLTKFAYDNLDDEIDVIIAANFTGPELYAFYKYAITIENGIRDAFGGFTAVDTGNYRNNVDIVSMYIDNTTTSEVWQTDSSRIYRSDETRPIKNPTTGGGGVDINWQQNVYVVTAGSGLTAGQAAELTQAANSSVSPATIADEVLDRNLAGGASGGRTVRDALRANRNRVVIDDQANTITVYEEDDTTIAWTAAITTGERNAVNSVDPA